MIAGLKLRTGDTSILYGDRIVMVKRWEAYAQGVVVDQGTATSYSPNLQKMPDTDLELQKACERRFASVVEHHRPRGAIGGLSAFDADLILDGWMQGEGLDHPVLGHIDANPKDIVTRVNRIIDTHAPPPMWFWAEAGEGAIRVKCIAVSGADSYNVYNTDELLGNVPNHQWQTVYVQPGNYSVRVAAVVDGVVGVRSFPVNVQIGEPLEAVAMSVPKPSRKVANLEKQVKALTARTEAAEEQAAKAKRETRHLEAEVSNQIVREAARLEPVVLEAGPVESEPLIPEPTRSERFKAFMKLGFWPW